jgi:hypothetical protein
MLSYPATFYIQAIDRISNIERQKLADSVSNSSYNLCFRLCNSLLSSVECRKSYLHVTVKVNNW